ncbi:rhomboid family intramembrane serine protease [Roseobacter ponti]|uniref:Rhomboid family intramembrane serine protease n=1 Tax=Roseobacter ponti TaxID=1891787 RepID=A0A858SRT0_9RHOB|nr:rhomboid family intramembrane serine protease [Roseobacter ponti]QJF51589.1 rhomboid family intramembrane serine protease [Roseobacter ponti]
MFPIRDHNPSGRTPFVTWALMAANILIFFSYWGEMDNVRYMNAFWYDWSLIPARVITGDGTYTIISAMFLHGGLMHLAGNMLFLFIFGDNIEDTMGHFGFLVFYLVCGVLASVAHIAIEPGSTVPLVGASGAIAGVMGAYLLLFPRARVDILLILIVIFRVFPIPAWIMLLLWFGMQFVGGIGAGAEAGGVAYWAHAGGFVAGVIGAVPIWLRLGGPAFWRRTHGEPPHPEAHYTVTSRVPRIKRR